MKKQTAILLLIALLVTALLVAGALFLYFLTAK